MTSTTATGRSTSPRTLQRPEKSVLNGIRKELGDLFVREVDGSAVDRWYRQLTEEKA